MVVPTPIAYGRRFLKLSGNYMIFIITPIQMGTFFSLEPFYIRHATAKDLVMYCCKTHRIFTFARVFGCHFLCQSVYCVTTDV